MIIKKDRDSIQSYLEDSSNLKGGHADEVVIPSDIYELSGFIKTANAEKKLITISGGGTSTTGSRIPFGGAVISMEKMDALIGLSKQEMSVAVQPGMLVDNLKSVCEQRGLFYTSHPTETTASVGGTVGTNASGARSLKYGPTRKYVKRLKMVLATGEIHEIRRGEKFLHKDITRMELPEGRNINIPTPTYKIPGVKNSAGYFACPGSDLIDLFIGQEGTLSVIAEIELAVVKKPRRILSFFVFFDEDKDAVAFAKEAKGAAGILSVEYFDCNSLRLLSAKNRNVPAEKGAAIFLEQELAGEEEDESLDVWVKLIARHNSSIDDTWVAMNEKDAGLFTGVRHALPEAVNDIYRKYGFSKLSTDIAVPDANFDELLGCYADSFRRHDLDHVIFGHIGESHLHVNILPRSKNEENQARELSLEFIKKGIALGGTVSAEHGIGKLKHRYLEEMYGRKGILEMVKIKKAFDPNCILGLDNIFPKEYMDLV